MRIGASDDRPHPGGGEVAAGLEIVEPGIVAVSQWYPDPDEIAEVAHD